MPCFTVVRVAGQIRDSGLIDSHFDSGLRAVNDGAVGLKANSKPISGMRELAVSWQNICSSHAGSVM